MRDRAVHLLSRLSFGPTEAEIARVLDMGEDDWLEEQLAPGEEQDHRLQTVLAEAETLKLSTSRLNDWLRSGFEGKADNELTAAERDEIRVRRRVPKAELVRAVFYRALFQAGNLARENQFEFFGGQLVAWPPASFLGALLA